MRLHNFTYTIVLGMAALLTACGQPDVQPEPAPHQDSGFFSPPPWNRWQQVDENTRIPVGIHSSQGFDWAPDDRPIYFHTFEEVDRRRLQWEPFLILDAPNYYVANRDLIAWKFSVHGDSPYDRHFAQLPERWETKRGSFIGFGEPFADEYLHMFECGISVSYIRYYRVKDYIVECPGVNRIRIYLVADPDAPPPPDLAPDDPSNGAPEHMPERWLNWLLDARAGSAEMKAPHPGPYDYSQLRRIQLFAYASTYFTGFETARFIEPGFLQSSDTGRNHWIIDAYRIPAEYCTESALQSQHCLPNSYRR